MKNLNELGVQELTNQELLEIQGGSIFSKAWDWVKDHFFSDGDGFGFYF